MTSHIDKQAFVEQLLRWQQQHGRHDLPWQTQHSPYRVMVSEIMLQQTQVTTVIPYFERWMQAFPTVQKLAQANEDEVMQLWQGLGYYSRARNLQKAARYVVNELNGAFPQDVLQLQKIPGVGRYTAGAIMSFAYDLPGAIVDGNVKRFFSRLFAIDGTPGTSAVDKQLWQLAETLTPAQHNRDFAQGLLDLGATLCKPKKPECQRCPFQHDCRALAQDAVARYPNPKPKKQIPVRDGHFIWLRHGSRILLHKRPDRGIWASLWCLPEQAKAPMAADPLASFKHTFTHYKLNAKVWLPVTQTQVLEPAADANPIMPSEQRWVELTELDTLGLPTPIKKFITKHFKA